MREFFTLTGGSVRGTTHSYRHTNCQDAYSIIEGDHITTATSAVVADGCGSGEFSEFGARLGCQVVANFMSERMLYGSCESDYTQSLDFAKTRLLINIRLLLRAMGQEEEQKLIDNFLFTLVGVAINNTHAVFYSFGDGYVIVNGEQTELGPFPGNAPPYIAYNILRPKDYPEDLLSFKIHQVVPLSELNHFVIATDGLSFLTDSAERPLPTLTGNKEELIGALSQFWENDKYTKLNQKGDVNHSLVSRRLNLINGGVPKHVVTSGEGASLIETLQVGLGPLRDDLALVVGRRVAWEK